MKSHRKNKKLQREEDEKFMRLALSLARMGVGWVDPNPAVGCVIVRGGQIIGFGYHTKFGCAHAEREALVACASNKKARSGEGAARDKGFKAKNVASKKSCKAKNSSSVAKTLDAEAAKVADDVASVDISAGAAAGATAYVTLEPCSHTGKQPPCTQALIAAGIKRVVVGQVDPNPLVSGRGIEQLRNAGIQVDTGILQCECEKFNRAWRHYITHNTPYVIMKYAMTANGKVAPVPRKRTQLTGVLAQSRTHEDRAAASAIMVGAHTVITDDPLLTCRLEDFAAYASCMTCMPPKIKQPLRVVLSGSANIPTDSRLVQSAADDAPVLVITSPAASGAQVSALQDAGVDVEVLPAGDDGRIKWQDILELLGERGVVSLIVEGGPTLHESLVKSGCVNEVQAYVAGKIISVEGAPSFAEGSASAEAPATAEGSAVAEALKLESHRSAGAQVATEGSTSTEALAASENDLISTLNLKDPEVEALGRDILITWSVE